MSAEVKWQRRTYEQHALVAVRKVRSIVLFWARQCRKSTTLGTISFDEMTRFKGRRVIAASASLLVGSELVQKTISSAEQAERVTREAAAVQMSLTQSALENRVSLIAADREKNKEYQRLSGDDFADLYRTSRLEMRLYHDRTTFSKLQVIAPNPATARGWSGTVVRDEAGFTPSGMESELRAAVNPIIDADRSFKMIYASNLPRDDRHPFFEQTLPDPELKFPPKPEGHFYRGQDGILIHRVALADAYAAGHTLYDRNSGKALPYDAFRKICNKLELPFNYDLIHEASGTAAIDFFALMSAQRRGASNCAFVFAENDSDVQKALDLLSVNLTGGQVGLGMDVATTTEETSNPSSITITERNGTERAQRLVLAFKEKKVAVMRDRLRRILERIENRPSGGRARRLCIDATNERLAAEETADELRGVIPVELVVSSVGVHPPGYTDPTNYKTWLGDIYSTAINDNHYSLPADAYIKEDQRLVLKDAGRYVCKPQADGKHGDTFDSGKLAEHALNSQSGQYRATVVT